MNGHLSISLSLKDEVEIRRVIELLQSLLLREITKEKEMFDMTKDDIKNAFANEPSYKVELDPTTGKLGVTPKAKKEEPVPAAYSYNQYGKFPRKKKDGKV